MEDSKAYSIHVKPNENHSVLLSKDLILWVYNVTFKISWKEIRCLRAFSIVLQIYQWNRLHFPYVASFVLEVSNDSHDKVVYTARPNVLKVLP